MDGCRVRMRLFKLISPTAMMKVDQDRLRDLDSPWPGAAAEGRTFTESLEYPGHCHRDQRGESSACRSTYRLGVVWPFWSWTNEGRMS